MNIVILTGRLTDTPELKTTNSGLSVVSARLAVDRGYGDKKTIDFIPVVFWRGTADTVAKYCTKGSKLTVSGRLQSRSYEDRNGKHTVYEVNVNEMELPPRESSPRATEVIPDCEVDESDWPF